MTYTDEKVNLVINKLTQGQYDQAQAEGRINQNELYITDQGVDVPTHTSDLVNNSGFITQADIPTNISSFNNDQGYIDASGKSEIQSDYDGKINNLKNDIELQIANLPYTTMSGEYEDGTSFSINVLIKQ